MVVLTVETNSNDHIIYFTKNLKRGYDCIRLISCSLYNSWYKLKERGEIGIVDNNGFTSTKIIPPGNYTLDGIGKKLQEILANESVEVKFEYAKGSIVIENPLKRKMFSIVT